MRAATVRAVLIVVAVLLAGALSDSVEAVNCSPARLFASASTGPGSDNVRVDPGSAENAGNEVGRFWQSSNSILGNNFDGACPSNNGDSTWWQTNAAERRWLEAYMSATGSDGTICEPTSCPAGDLTVIVEDVSEDGDDALFIAFRVDESPPELRWWDYSRVDPSPSPSVLQMLSFPPANVVAGSGLPGGNIQVELLLEDIAPNVHAVNGPSDDPLPATSIVSTYDVYVYDGTGVPGRDVADWTLIERVPYEDGPVSATVEISCEDSPQIAIGLSFEGGEGPDVVSAYVGRAAHLECNQNPVEADAGEDQVAECAGPDGTPVTLDGTGTTGATEVEWRAQGILFDDPHSMTPTGWFPVGSTDVTLIALFPPYLDTDGVQVTIVDETEPMLDCALNVVGMGMGDDDEGGDGLQFAISLMAADLCCGGAETSAEIDLGWSSLPVADGQVIGLRCAGMGDDEGSDCQKVGNCDGHLTIRSAEATVRGVATDCNGNVATCELNLCEPPSGGSWKETETAPRREAGRMEFGSSD